jgi:hypothetical protein
LLEQGAQAQALHHFEAAVRDGPRHPDIAWMQARIAELRSRHVVPREETE